jgi:ATP-binding cassette subfamily F protein uup
MTALEGDIARAEAALADAELFTKDPKKFETNAAIIETAKAALAAAEEEWLQLEMLREAAENGE